MIAVKRVFVKAVAPALLAIVTGCSTGRPHRLYEGDPQSVDGVARIVASPDVEIVAVDGEKRPMSMNAFARRDVVYHLLPGPHELDLVYYEIWPVAEDEHESLRSDPVSVSVDAAAGAVYRVTYPEPQTVEEAIAFAESPQFAIELTVLPPASSRAGNVTHPDEETEVPVAEPDDGEPSYKMLKYWWKNADEKDRKRFRDHMEQDAPEKE